MPRELRRFFVHGAFTLVELLFTPHVFLADCCEICRSVLDWLLMSFFPSRIFRAGREEMKHLDQSELAKRWKISPHTLENMRWRKLGPPYIKIGGRVLYRVEDI